jgi:hypothetical protein
MGLRLIAVDSAPQGIPVDGESERKIWNLISLLQLKRKEYVILS